MTTRPTDEQLERDIEMANDGIGYGTKRAVGMTTKKPSSEAMRAAARCAEIFDPNAFVFGALTLIWTTKDWPNAIFRIAFAVMTILNLRAGWN